VFLLNPFGVPFFGGYFQPNLTIQF
jgi:hypothetical protein